LSEAVEKSLVDVCVKISKRYEIHFVEIGAEDNQVHFLTQSVPRLSVEVIVRTIKNIMAKELFRLHPEINKQLWRGNFCTSGYYVNTAGQYTNEEVIQIYIQNQGNDTSQYKKFIETICC
jgi:putative transposase